MTGNTLQQPDLSAATGRYVTRSAAHTFLIRYLQQLREDLRAERGKPGTVPNPVLTALIDSVRTAATDANARHIVVALQHTDRISQVAVTIDEVLAHIDRLVGALLNNLSIQWLERESEEIARDADEIAAQHAAGRTTAGPATRAAPAS
jgi:HAMP domain-containing protein